MKRIVISGYYGFNNAGDEAVLGAMLDTMRENAGQRGEELSFTVLSANPSATAQRYGVHAIGRVDIFRIIAALFRADLFISGGGGLLQDATGFGLSVAYYLGLVLMARLLGKPTVFYAHGIGPVRRFYNRALTRLIANRVNLITVRDEASREELARMGVTKPPTYVTADPAFLLEPPDHGNGALDKLLEPLDGRPKIGIAVRSWRGQERYLREIASAADFLANELTAGIVLIPMYQKEDLPVSRELAGLMSHTPVILEENLAPPQLLSLFTRLDLVLAVRLHALIFAAVAGVPLVGVGYDPKVDAFLGRLGLPTAGVPAEVDAPLLVQQALERWHDRDNVRTLLNNKREDFRAEALECAGRIVDYLFESGETPSRTGSRKK